MIENWNIVTKEVRVGDTVISFETGKLAKQAGGAVMCRMGETEVLVTATAAKEARVGIDFFPLTCDYVEKSYAAGKIPGSYFRREGRQNEFEVLASRLMDRPIRPLFPDGFRCETQVVATVLSHDKMNESQICALNGASAALHISDIPFDGPTAAVRVARIDGVLVANPSLDRLADADINRLVATSPDGICMVEGGADFADEEAIIDALYFAHDACQAIMKVIGELREAAGRPKRTVVPPVVNAELQARVHQIAKAPLIEALSIKEKLPRYDALDAAKAQVLAQFSDEERATSGKEISGYISGLKKDIVRHWILDEGRRIDGRGTANVRPIHGEIGVLPRAHGSSVFTRGETQALATCTLGTRHDNQRIETLVGDVTKDFLLHYNFPPFSVGETARDRPRRSGPPRPGAGAAGSGQLPLHHPHRERDPGVQRLLVHGHGVLGLDGPDGCRSADRQPRGGHRHGPHQ